MTSGKMYKIMMPIENAETKKTHWLRLGNAFTNKDASLNCYLESIPISVFAGKEFKFQLRELDEDDLRRRDERRSGDNSNGASASHGTLGAAPF